MRVPWIMVAGLTLTFGCGGASSPPPAAKDGGPGGPVPTTTEDPEPPGTPPSDPAPPRCEELTLYLHGGPLPGAEVDVEFDRIEVTRAGLPVPTSFTAGGAQLTFPRPGAYRMAVLPFDKEGGPMEAAFVPARMSYCRLPDGTLTGRACRSAETCGGAIQLRFDPAKVRADHCHVFVRLDLVSSMQRWAGGWWFVPHHQVQY